MQIIFIIKLCDNTETYLCNNMMYCKTSKYAHKPYICKTNHWNKPHVYLHFIKTLSYLQRFKPHSTARLHPASTLGAFTPRERGDPWGLLLVLR